MQTYQSSLGADENHSLESIVIFLHRLAQVSNKACEGILGNDTLEFFVHLYIANFFDPLAIETSHGRSALRAACDSLLHTCSGTQTGLEILSQHQIYMLWPTILPKLPSSSLPADRHIQRANIWRTMEPKLILLRMESIFRMMVMENREGMLGQDSLENVAADILEFST